jgi:hypothetical protein
MLSKRKGNADMMRDEIARILREELGKIPQSKDGWRITEIKLDGEPVELPEEWNETEKDSS